MSPKSFSQVCKRSLCAAVSLSLAAASLSFAFGGPSTSSNASEGWIQLFDGSSRFGWTQEGGNWQIANGALISDAVLDSRLRMDAAFSDFDLKMEARVVGGPATLLLRADPQSEPSQPGYGLSLADGTLDGVNGAGARGSGANLAAGVWHTYEVRADGAHLIASVDGNVTADWTNKKNRVGYFELDAPHGTRLELRSATLKPLDLHRVYNGSNLDGWRAVARPAPESKPKLKLPIPGLSSKPNPPKSVLWSGENSISGAGGEGQLESTQTYDDFILQFAAKSSPGSKEEQAASGFFFRGAAGKTDSGYMVSTEMAKGNEPQDAKHFGLGSLVQLDKARPVAVADGQYFNGTIDVRNHRLCIWINGKLVTDYYDSRPDGVYQSAAGTFGFRILNEHATLNVREVEALALPKGPEPPPPLTPVPAPTAAATTAATSAIAPVPPMGPPAMPGQSPEEKAREIQVRTLTTEALNTSSPEDSIRINKQILVLDPADMPAQERLDKAQAEVDTSNALKEHGIELRHASAAKLEENATRRDALLLETQDALLRGNTSRARDKLNDAQRLGARGQEVDHLQSIIETRTRNRIMLWVGLGGISGLSVIFAGIFFWRRRRQVIVAYLVALDGPEKGKRYLLNQEITHLGGVAMDGSKKNEVIVRDPDRLVSRFHCEVHKRRNACYVIDLDSANGTFLKNQRLAPGVAARLRDGDRLSLARAAAFKLQFERSSTR
ncbi:family 16 glycoside hydrolase [Granulicella sp. S190]|uniref:family 16 glycoside hydrolase n=1 Tax=Granulicella sp. S190 TaxID=1747226 RepID=UPI0020B1593F|nr:family 16 glycoside hydrolase [Granulicella sp. S190]